VYETYQYLEKVDSEHFSGRITYASHTVSIEKLRYRYILTLPRKMGGASRFD
jgi:hypothetical protein